MKKYRLLLLFVLVFVVAEAQENSGPRKKFIIASLSYEMGPMLDRCSAVNMDMMYDLTINSSDIERDLLGHDILYDTDLEGSRIGATVSLIPLNRKEKDYSTKREIRLGLFYMVRGAHLSFSLSNPSGAYKAVGYSTRFKELSLHGAYVWKYSPKFAERFTLHAGVGLGLGSTVNDKTSVAEIISSGLPAEVPNSIFNVYDGKTSLFLRAYTLLGIDFAISERFDIGIQSYIGIVSQQVLGGNNYFIPVSGSVGIKLSYFF